MIVHRENKKKCGSKGLVNSIINKLPFELHLPGYQYCGPGTKLIKRLAHGDRGINRLDSACREHNIAYSQNRDNIGARNAADKILAEKSWNHVLATDSSLSEKAVTLAITTIMKAKSKLGMSLKRKKRQKKNNIS